MYIKTINFHLDFTINQMSLIPENNYLMIHVVDTCALMYFFKEKAHNKCIQKSKTTQQQYLTSHATNGTPLAQFQKCGQCWTHFQNYNEDFHKGVTYYFNKEVTFKELTDQFILPQKLKVTPIVHSFLFLTRHFEATEYSRLV